MTPAQCKAARALLGIRQQDLAEAVGLDVKTITRHEGGFDPRMTPENVSAVRRYLEEQGLSFVYRGVVFTADFLRDQHEPDGHTN